MNKREERRIRQEVRKVAKQMLNERKYRSRSKGRRSRRRRLDEGVGGMVDLPAVGGVNGLSGRGKRDKFEYRGLEGMQNYQLDVVTENLDRTVEKLKNVADGQNNKKLSEIIKRLGEIREEIFDL